MPANTTHNCFPQPSTQALRLWRYLDFTKFVSLIDSRSLFFSRADRLSDPFEGSYPQANVELRPKIYPNLSEHDVSRMADQKSRFAQWVRAWTHISCWHANQFESAAMWHLYASVEGSVAIETTYERLAAALPDNCHLGLVKYIDYQTEPLSERNSLHPFMHKRKSFEHEREVRAVIQDLPSHNGTIPVGIPNGESGLVVPVNIASLVVAVHVSPSSPRWLENLVSNVLDRYGITCAVKRSDLSASPVY